jgi:hypothetical protein
MDGPPLPVLSAAAKQGAHEKVQEDKPDAVADIRSEATPNQSEIKGLIQNNHQPIQHNNQIINQVPILSLHSAAPTLTNDHSLISPVTLRSNDKSEGVMQVESFTNRVKGRVESLNSLSVETSAAGQKEAKDADGVLRLEVLTPTSGRSSPKTPTGLKAGGGNPASLSDASKRPSGLPKHLARFMSMSLASTMDSILSQLQEHGDKAAVEQFTKTKREALSIINSATNSGCPVFNASSERATEALERALVTPRGPNQLPQLPHVKQKRNSLVEIQIHKELKNERREKTQVERRWKGWGKEEPEEPTSPGVPVKDATQLKSLSAMVLKVHHSRQEDRQQGKWVIDPNARFFWIWNFIMLFNVIWSSVAVPFKLAFYTQENKSLIWLDIFIELIFITVSRV